MFFLNNKNIQNRDKPGQIKDKQRQNKQGLNTEKPQQRQNRDKTRTRRDNSARTSQQGQIRDKEGKFRAFFLNPFS